MRPCVSDLLLPRSPLRWSRDQRAAHVVAEGSAGSSEPWRRCLVRLLRGVPGQIRRFGLDRRPLSGSGTVPTASSGDAAGRTAGTTSQALRGDERAHGCGLRQGTAGNGRERQGLPRRHCPRSLKSIGWAACRPKSHSRRQLRTSTLEVAAAAGVGTGTSPLQSAAAISGLAGQADDVVTYRHGRAAYWPNGVRALSARPVVVVNDAAPGTSQVLSLLRPSPGWAACHARPEEAGKRCDTQAGHPPTLCERRQHRRSYGRRTLHPPVPRRSRRRSLEAKSSKIVSRGTPRAKLPGPAEWGR
jgi:hypothetical protein